MERLIIRPTPLSRFPCKRRPFMITRAFAFRLKVAVLAVACVGAAALGIASASLNTRTFPRAGRTVSLHEFQVVLQTQANACVAERPAPVDATSVVAR
jgi:hypothetical protein